MVSYFENIHGVPRIAENFNPVRLFLILDEFLSSLGRSFSVSEACEMQEARSLWRHLIQQFGTLSTSVQATWMLDISTISAEAKLGLDLADVYLDSDLHQ